MLGKPWWLLAVFGNQCPGMLSTRAVAVISTPCPKPFWFKSYPFSCIFKVNSVANRVLPCQPGFARFEHFFVTLLCQTALLKFAMSKRKHAEAIGKEEEENPEGEWKHTDEVVNQCRAVWTEHMSKKDSFVYSEKMEDGAQTEKLKKNDQNLVEQSI